MKSISLAEFVEENDIATAAAKWRVSRQAVEACLRSGRNIRFIWVGDVFEVHEDKVLASHRIGVE
jgi:hypothetical protein